MLLYNSINKNINDNDPLTRWLVVHLITSLRGQTINHDCAKQLVSLCVDSNPLVKRISLLSLVEYIKANTTTSIVSPEEMRMVLKRYFNDPHPLVFSTAFHAIIELNYKDYIEIGLPKRLMYLFDNLSKIDDFYFERCIFGLINFSKLFLFNNFDKNNKYIIKFFNSLYTIAKYTTNSSKTQTCLSAIYEIITEIKGLRLNSISLEEFKLFKNGKQLNKVANLLIKNFLCSKCPVEKYLSLDLINKYLASMSEHFDIINNDLMTHLNIFFLNYNDKAFINTKKLEILIQMSNEKNIKTILDELRKCISYPNISRSVVSSIYHICQTNKDNNSNISALCIERLVDMLKLKDDNVIAQIIISLRKLILDIKEHTRYVLVYSIKNYKKIVSPCAKSNIIWMISQHIDIIPTVSVDFFRRLLIDIDSECDDIKSQILGLGLRIYSKIDHLTGQFKDDVRSRITSLINYAVEKVLYDKNYHLREKARLVNFVVKNNLLNDVIDYRNIGKVLAQAREGDDSVRTFMLGFFDKVKLETKFVFDSIDKSVDPGIYKISLDDIISTLENNAKPVEEPKNNSTRYQAIKQENNTNSTVSNFDSNVNIEEIRNKLQNELDNLLNNDEEDDWEVEIKKD
jgi:vesicle coat complex subunit